MESSNYEPPLDTVRVFGLSIGEEYFIDDAVDKTPMAAIVVTGIPCENITLSDGTKIPPKTTADVLYLKPGEDDPIHNPYLKSGKIPAPNSFLSDIASDTQDKLGTGYREMQIEHLLDRVFDTTTGKEVVSLLEDSKKSPNMLIIFGHGGGDPWEVGEAFDTRISVNKLLQGIDSLIARVYTDTTPVSDRYACIVLAPCNRKRVEVPQELSKHVGLDIFYVQGLSGLGTIYFGESESAHVRP
jgi:hypothetical protein